MISEALGERFGAASIFRDIDTIRPGTNFAKAIENAVSSCAALLVVIGKDWLTTPDDEGRRRLDDPEDYVRLEVLAGLRRDDVLVVPVLVEGARMPSEEQMPAGLAPLSQQMALELTDTGWSHQIDQLVDVLSTVVEPAGPEAPPPSPSVPPTPTQPVTSALPRRALAATAFAVVGAAAVVLLLLRPGTRPPVTPDPVSSTVAAVATSSPATSAGLQALDLVGGSGYTVQVPRNWLHSDVPTAEPGAGPAEVWADPDDPNRRLRIIASRCTACAATPEGAANVKQLIPQPNVRFAEKSSTLATYEAYEAGNPLKINGVVRIYRDGATVKGYYRVDLWLPDELHATASLILNSFRGSI